MFAIMADECVDISNRELLYYLFVFDDGSTRIVLTLVRIVLVKPAKNSVSERSFSAKR